MGAEGRRRRVIRDCSYSRFPRRCFRANTFRGRGRGFTLIELTACLILVGLIATVATVSLGGVQRVHEMEDVIDQLGLIDYLAREHAERFDRPETLLFDLEAGRIQRLGPDDRAGANGGSSWTLPTGFVLRGVRVQGQDWSTRQVAVEFSSAGISPTYAVQISHEGMSADVWLIIAGACGRLERVENQEVVDAVFDAI